MKWDEAENFTWEQLSTFTWDQLNRLTPEELIIIMNAKIEIVSKKHPEMKEHLKGIATNLLSSALYDGMKHLIMLIQNLL